MKKSQIASLPRFFDRYINLVTDVDLVEALETYTPEAVFHNRAAYTALGDRVYQADKWTVKDILQHCIDTERVMAYRAMTFARQDRVELPGFDEETFARNTSAAARSLDDLFEEYHFVRKANIYQFKNFNPDNLTAVGTANGTPITPLSLGFVIVGHSLHHQRILEERYFPLLG